MGSDPKTEAGPRTKAGWALVSDYEDSIDARRLTERVRAIEDEAAAWWSEPRRVIEDSPARLVSPADREGPEFHDYGDSPIRTTMHGPTYPDKPRADQLATQLESLRVAPAPDAYSRGYNDALADVRDGVNRPRLGQREDAPLDTAVLRAAIVDVEAGYILTPDRTALAYSKKVAERYAYLRTYARESKP